MGPGEGIISPCEMVMFARACSDDSNQRWSIKMTEHGKVFQNKRTVLFPGKKKRLLISCQCGCLYAALNFPYVLAVLGQSFVFFLIWSEKQKMPR